MTERGGERQREVERGRERRKQAEGGGKRRREAEYGRERERRREEERSCSDNGTIKGHCRYLQYFCKCFQLKIP